MLHLRFAPSLDLLVSDLLSGVRKIWTDPFEPPEILVPSPALGKWLSMRLADGKIEDDDKVTPFGCVANLEFRTIERYLWDLLQPDQIRMLGQQDIQQILCALLTDECINQPGFEPVKRYLAGKDGIDPVKKVQLAARIANRFIEYEYNRPGVWRKKGIWDPPGIDGTWMRGKSHSGDTVNEVWQAALYRKMRGCFPQKQQLESDPAATRYLTLPQLYRLRRENGMRDAASWVVSPRTIYMFGLAKISHFYRNLLVEISQMDGVDLHVYLTNPCAEFWEDVDTTRKHSRMWSSRDPDCAVGSRQPDDYDREELGDLNDKTDHTLLKLWGHAGKENIFLWCQDAEWNFEYRCPEWVDNDREPATVLEALRFSLLRRSDTCLPPRNGLTGDTSLQILACPDRGREIEEIREQILDMVRDGTIGMLNEVVVYLTDPTLYVPYIQRVFGRFRPNDPEYIPFCILGTSGKETAFAQGIGTLLEIMRQRFDRATIFALLRNPIVQETRGIASEDVAIWEQWAEECAIFRGYNHEHRRIMGDTGGTVTDAHTFELGMARMLLADLAAGPVDLHFTEKTVSDSSGDTVPIPVIPYRDFNTSERKKLEQFCATVEALHYDGTLVSDDVASDIRKAIETFLNVVGTWMGKIPESGGIDPSAEGSMLRGFYDGVWKILLQQTQAGREKMPFEEFHALILGCLPEEGAHHLAAWTGGITFAPLKPAMIVPHTIVVAAGLDDVLFPGSNVNPSWDLLAQKRIIGDSDRVRDNRFAFLELLHAARKRLLLSYRARDMQKEARLHPSSVILELEGFLSENGFTIKDEQGMTTCSVTRTVPWIVHESLQRIARAGRKHGSWNKSDIDLDRVARSGERTGHRYELDTSAGVTATDGESPHFSTYSISEYLKNPLEYHLARTLGISSDESPGTVTATDEPLGSDFFSSSMLYRAVWIAVLRKMFPDKKSDSLDDNEALRTIACREAVRRYTMHVASGNAPEAMLEEIEKSALFRWARYCIEPLLPLKEHFTDHRLLEKTDLSFGREGFPRALAVAVAADRSCTVDGSHNLVLMPRKSDTLQTAIIGIRNRGRIQQNTGLCVEGVVQWLYEKKNNPEQKPVMLLQLNQSDTPVIQLFPLTGDSSNIEKMHHWVARILDEMIHRGSDHFPFSVIERITRPPKRDPASWKTLLKRITRERLETELADKYGYTSYNQAFTLVDPLLPSDDDEVLQSLADARFGPILDGWIFDKEAVS